ncbi:TMAO reductase sytem sensor TorS, partial [Vibrio parahaemolyticus V-223/04]
TASAKWRMLTSERNERHQSNY